MENGKTVQLNEVQTELMWRIEKTDRKAAKVNLMRHNSHVHVRKFFTGERELYRSLGNPISDKAEFMSYDVRTGERGPLSRDRLERLIAAHKEIGMPLQNMLIDRIDGPGIGFG